MVSGCYPQPRGDSPSCRSHRAEPLSPCIASCSRGGRVGQAAQGVMLTGPGSLVAAVFSCLLMSVEQCICPGAPLRCCGCPWGLGSHRAVSVPAWQSLVP